MVHKLIGFYGDRPEYTPKATDQLAIEIGSDQFVCMVKNASTNEIDAIEFFQIDQSNLDWSDILFEIKQNSKILGPSYSNTSIFYNFEEALVLPIAKMSATASEDYLSLIFGEDERTDTKFDSINTTLPTVTVYRIKKSLTELLNRNFLLFKTQHIYTNILNDLLNRENLPSVFLKLIVYQNHFIVVLIKDNELQLIQSYNITNSDDILYFIINIANQTGLSPLQAKLEVSGLVDLHTDLLEQLKKSFGIVSFDLISNQESIKVNPSNYSPYFLTPFFKLVV
ncbi:MAG: DUF3822 family protein [Bacteroidetes bacterium]|nr:DUF3822 family protein [Bacteroidota bacterium]